MGFSNGFIEGNEEAIKKAERLKKEYFEEKKLKQ